MATVATIPVGEKGPVEAVQSLLAKLLAEGEMDAVFVSRHLPLRGTVMPSLIADPKELTSADPLAPAFPLNAAKMVSRLTKGFTGTKQVAAVLRPCEIRAFVELVKLNQGSMDNILLIGFDCPGAFANLDYQQFIADGDPMARTSDFLSQAAAGETSMDGVTVARACLACEHPVAEAADLILGLAGADLNSELPILGNTARGEGVLTRLSLADAKTNGARDTALDDMVKRRTEYRDAMLAQTREQTNSLADLAQYLSGCVNCYNCRAACPVCYCKECVFLTDVFDYKADQYLGWAAKRGAIKMPTDTVFFHMTRLAHMSTSCVGCGQCSNACPNNVPVMELFRSVADKTQQAFEYVPGRSPDEAPPMTVFREDEFSEITGGAH